MVFTRAVEDATIWAGFDTHGDVGNRKRVRFRFCLSLLVMKSDTTKLGDNVNLVI